MSTGTKKRAKRKPKPKLGRPSTYLPVFCRQAKELAAMGFTDVQLAAFFQVSVGGLNKWKIRHPEFRAVLHEARWVAAAKVARSLYHRARGYSHRAVKIFADPKTGMVERVPYVEHYPPDTAAAKFWLTNRAPDQWKEKVVQEVTGSDGGPVQVQQVATDYNALRASLPKRAA